MSRSLYTFCALVAGALLLLMAAFGLDSLRDRLVVCDGNSLVAGRSAGPGRTFPDQLQARLGRFWEVQNLGVGGQTTGKMLADAGHEIDPRAAGARDPVCVVWEGTNDLYFGATPEEAFDRLAEYCRGRQDAGYRVVVLTLLPRQDFPGTAKVDRATHEARRLEVNRLLLERHPEFADDLVDVAGLPEFRDPADTRWFADGVHLTPEGYGVVAALVATSLRSLGE